LSRIISNQKDNSDSKPLLKSTNTLNSNNNIEPKFPLLTYPSDANDILKEFLTADLTGMHQALDKTAIFKHRFLTTKRKDFHTTIYILEGWMPKMKAEEVYKFFFDFQGPMYLEKSDEFLGRPQTINKDENI